MKWIAKLKTAVRREPDRRAELPTESGMPQAPGLGPLSANRLKTLTRREREVFAMLVQGQKMREAAEALGVKLTTISFHSTALYRKLDVHNRAQLILRYGLSQSAQDDRH